MQMLHSSRTKEFQSSSGFSVVMVQSMEFPDTVCEATVACSISIYDNNKKKLADATGDARGADSTGDACGMRMGLSVLEGLGLGLALNPTPNPYQKQRAI